ncbi:hypothetical protein XENTR_v10006945 [Xenopus tropicalis]|uniref:NEDD4-binding protein 2-like 2 n=1 Tax=Xenopus tropicalis TaxID=8364 RepID=A0A6I8RYP2_XENTR|nr:NEDD4-binding protein 2-like 2 [Xenopus tropicalis]KAE8627328.1 hypothetical protein XENTR_v10006945 [Xenopus tropicalis]KAE8627329.1 hypothetical protein XENTR_v10006945 [Xenopus tropicalis]
MPHAENEVSWDGQDSFIEPSLKRLKPDDSGLHTSRNPAVSTKRRAKPFQPHSRYFYQEHETKTADKKSAAETEHSTLQLEKKSLHSKGTSGLGYNDAQGALFIPLESSDEENCNMPGTQHLSERPYSDRCKSNRIPKKESHSSVLEKSHVFIGPVFQPAPKTEQRSETTHEFIGPVFQTAPKAELRNEVSHAFIGPLLRQAPTEEQGIKTGSVSTSPLFQPAPIAEQGSRKSHAFIGPQCPPNPKAVLWNENVKNWTESKSPHFKISTVELGKVSGRAGAQNGMDYELRQFYKELQILEAETDDNGKESESKANDNKEFTLLNKSSQDSSTFLRHVGTPNNKAICDGQSHLRELLPYDYIKNCYLNNTVPPPRFQIQPPPRFQIQQPPHLQNQPPLHFQNQPPPHFQNHLPPNFSVSHGPPPLPPTPPYNHPVPHPIQNAFAPCTENKNIRYGHNEHQRQDQQHWNSFPIPHNAGNSNLKEGNILFLDSECGKRQQEHRFGDALGNQESHSGAAQLHNYTYVPQERHTEDDNKKTSSDERKLVLLRGLPGSGKTTLARFLLNLNPNGFVFSTDDYFCQKDGYTYDVKLLGDAHNWNQCRARRAMDDGRSPIIIDNTNIQGWEMKPYVQMAIERGYFVDFVEPDNWWKLDPLELAKRNTHRVPQEKISQMLERYEHNMTVPVVMNSVEPPHKNAHRRPPQPRPRWGASVDFSHHNRTFHNR